jgi:hypothetical protein
VVKRPKMKKHLTIVILVLIVGLSSCSSDKGKSKDNVPAPFRQFLKKFKQLQLPLTLRQDNIDTLGLPNIDMKNVDTLFIKNNDGLEKYYGMLPDTNYYYGLIVLYPGGCDYLPVLLTFDKSGNKISEERLLNRGCGEGPGLVYCSATGVINNDLTIYLVDTLKTVSVDSILKPIDGTRKYYCMYKKGKINSNGKITMTGEHTKYLK